MFNDFISPLQSLINLGTTKSNFIEELTLFQQAEPDHEINIYFSQSFYHAKIKENLIFHDMIFMLGDIYESLEQRINNWITVSKELESVIHLFTRAKISSEMFLELKFLTIAQAIETYHRNRRDSNILPKDEFKRQIKKIIGGVPNLHEQWLKENLAHSNKKTLKMRLEDLLKETTEIMQPIIEDSSEFIKKVGDTRNYLTHYDKREESKAAKNANLHWLTEKLFILLQSCLMGEIGLNQEQQITLFRRYEYYTTLINSKTAQ